MTPQPPPTTGRAAAETGVRVSRLPARVAPPAPPVIRVLPGTPESAAAARRLAQRLLGDRHPAADTVMLLLSELVTNSVLHSQSRRPGGTVTVVLCAGPTSVLIQVRDDGGQYAPQLPPGGAHDARGGATAAANAGGEHGYGLLLVDALAESWGTMTTRDGRVTWCRLSVPQAHVSGNGPHSQR